MSGVPGAGPRRLATKRSPPFVFFSPNWSQAVTVYKYFWSTVTPTRSLRTVPSASHSEQRGAYVGFWKGLCDCIARCSFFTAFLLVCATPAKPPTGSKSIRSVSCFFLDVAARVAAFWAALATTEPSPCCASRNMGFAKKNQRADESCGQRARAWRAGPPRNHAPGCQRPPRAALPRACCDRPCSRPCSRCAVPPNRSSRRAAAARARRTRTQRMPSAKPSASKRARRRTARTASARRASGRRTRARPIRSDR
eukprot:1692526-Prymnesium_polylepis.2